MAFQFSQNQISEFATVFSTVRFLKRQGFGPGRGKWVTEFLIRSEQLASCANSSEAVDLIKRELAALPPMALEDGDWLLSIPPAGPQGFAVDLCRTQKVESLRALFGDAEFEFENLDTALVWVGRALSSAYQLRTTFFRSRPRIWRLEPVGNAHGEALETGYGLPWFWLGQGTRTEIRHNNLSA